MNPEVAFSILKDGSPWAVPVLAVALLPLLIRWLKDTLELNETLRHSRLRNIEKAAPTFVEETVERKLFEELRAQEAFYASTGLRLARSERVKVLSWLESAPVTIDLLRAAWPQINYKDGELKPFLDTADGILMWYGFSMTVVLIAFTVLLTALAALSIMINFKLEIVLSPVVSCIFAMLVKKQIESYFAARRLTNRLSMSSKKEA